MLSTAVSQQASEHSGFKDKDMERRKAQGLTLESLAEVASAVTRSRPPTRSTSASRLSSEVSRSKDADERKVQGYADMERRKAHGLTLESLAEVATALAEERDAARKMASGGNTTTSLTASVYGGEKQASCCDAQGHTNVGELESLHWAKPDSQDTYNPAVLSDTTWEASYLVEGQSYTIQITVPAAVVKSKYACPKSAESEHDATNHQNMSSNACYPVPVSTVSQHPASPTRKSGKYLQPVVSMLKLKDSNMANKKGELVSDNEMIASSKASPVKRKMSFREDQEGSELSIMKRRKSSALE
jgi:hypothetical protein